MGLKQDIVIVNEYTVPLPGGKGSRGGTPGAYVTRYMARELATEPLAPIRRHRADDFIVRYMARDNAVEAVEAPDNTVFGSAIEEAIARRGPDPTRVKRRMKDAQKEGGVAFGYGQVSLSHEQLEAAAADIQAHFEAGHTVMKTVLSFDESYLKKHGLIDEDFVLQKRGDYRGHLDQMKLRLAIMRGVERMSKASYDDLRVVGVIQVDTAHVHAHLAMVDAGEGSLASDGTQRGKISSKSKSLMRRGINSYLDDKQKIRHLSSAVGYERRNVATYMKRWAHQQMVKESLPQFLLATLPTDRRMWRASTNHEAMKKPNRIAREMVEEVLQRPGSPMAEAMEKVQNYADQRQRDEKLSTAAWQKLVRTGRERIIDRGINAVYAQLRQMPDDLLQVRTPMLDAMGMDYQQMAQQAKRDDKDDLIGFGFRLRSFSTRMEHHDDRRQHYHELVRSWEAADEVGAVSPASRALYEFYLEEEEYNAKVASKYRHFLSFVPPRQQWYEGWDDVSEYGERMLSLESMRNDTDLKKMKDPDEAERVGREVYSQAGGHLVSLNTEESLAKLDERIAAMRRTYAAKVEDLRVSLSSKGLRLEVVEDEDGRDRPVVTRGAEHPFDEVKGLDLHHMRFDFSSDVEVGEKARSAFMQATRRRAQKLEAAVAYLKASKQQEAIEELPVSDVRSMVKMADRIRSQGQEAVLPSSVAELVAQREQLRRSRTVRLTTKISDQISRALSQPVDFDPAQEEVEPVREEGIV